MLDRVTFAMSTEETAITCAGSTSMRRKAQGIATLRAVATDGHRLGLCEVPLPEGAAGMRASSCPARPCRNWARWRRQ